jgi:hypothetical protein
MRGEEFSTRLCPGPLFPRNFAISNSAVCAILSRMAMAIPEPARSYRAGHELHQGDSKGGGCSVFWHSSGTIDAATRPNSKNLALGHDPVFGKYNIMAGTIRKSIMTFIYAIAIFI